MTERVKNPESEQQNKANEDEPSKVQKQDLYHVENTLNEEVNQGVDEGMLEQEKHTGVHLERKENPLIINARVNNAQSSQEKSEEKLVSQGVKRKVVQLATIKHQGKALSMLGEIGVGQRPKTIPKNKLRLNMKNLLNPKLAQEKITVIEDSSSQEELEEDENLNEKEVKGKRHVPLKVNSSSTKTKISELLKQA